MRRINRMILCLFLIPNLLMGQGRKRPLPIRRTVSLQTSAPGDSLIVYDPARPLVLSDFEGPADAGSDGVAATFSGMQMAFYGEESGGVLQVDVQVLVYFNKTKSWTKKDGRNKVVLAHEQIHFDITALYACAFIHAVKEYPFTPLGIKQELRALNKQFMEQMQQAQDSYDRETRHGTIKEEQAAWAARIRKQLDTQDCYQQNGKQ